MGFRGTPCFNAQNDCGSTWSRIKARQATRAIRALNDAWAGLFYHHINCRPSRLRLRDLRREEMIKFRATPVLMVVVVLSGCMTSGVWTKAEVQEWSARWALPREVMEEFAIGYIGSDKKFHHFMARPIDSWVIIRTTRDEIDLPRIYDRKGSFFTSERVHYWVIPSRDFAPSRAEAEPDAKRGPRD